MVMAVPPSDPTDARGWGMPSRNSISTRSTCPRADELSRSTDELSRLTDELSRLADELSRLRGGRDELSRLTRQALHTADCEEISWIDHNGEPIRPYGRQSVETYGRPHGYRDRCLVAQAPRIPA